MPNHSVEHLLDTVSLRFSQVQLTVSEPTVVSSVSVANLTSAPASPCFLSPPPCPLHRTSAWMLPGVGDELEEVRRPVTDASGGFAAARERRSVDGAVQRRPSHRMPPRGLPLPSARCHPRREPLGAERALYRRCARTATPPWTGAITPSPTRISGGTAPVHLPDAAWPLKLLAKPLPRRNCSPERSRSRPPPRTAYK